jgi:hypothetical protein
LRKILCATTLAVIPSRCNFQSCSKEIGNLNQIIKSKGKIEKIQRTLKMSIEQETIVTEKKEQEINTFIRTSCFS